MGYIFAVLSSVCWGGMGVFSVKSTRRLHPLVGAFTSTVTGVLLIAIVVIVLGHFRWISTATLPLVLLFAGAGITEYVFGRTFMFISMKRVGAARTQPVSSTSILMAPFIAMFLLDEALSFKIVLGLLCAFAGSFLIIRGQKQ